VRPTTTARCPRTLTCRPRPPRRPVWASSLRVTVSMSCAGSRPVAPDRKRRANTADRCSATDRVVAGAAARLRPPAFLTTVVEPAACPAGDSTTVVPGTRPAFRGAALRAARRSLSINPKRDDCPAGVTPLAGTARLPRTRLAAGMGCPRRLRTGSAPAMLPCCTPFAPAAAGIAGMTPAD
jgi:hypothetical protein